MQPTIIQDKEGKQTAVLIPMDDWLKIKSIYPDIEDITDTLSNWQKDIVEERLEKLKNDPSRTRSIEDFFD